MEVPPNGIRKRPGIANKSKQEWRYPEWVIRLATRRSGPAARRLGFSLIELMISLGIIGILATLAIPRFLGYRIRAMQSEVKANLGGLKNAEAAFYAEHNTFTDDLSKLAWRPDGSPRYLYGFTSDGVPDASGMNDTAELAAAGVGLYATQQMVIELGVPLTDADLPTATATAGAYTFGAAGNLDPDASLDRWTISEAGIQTLIENDATND